jgi:hypothetical protein
MLEKREMTKQTVSATPNYKPVKSKEEGKKVTNIHM